MSKKVNQNNQPGKLQINNSGHSTIFSRYLLLACIIVLTIFVYSNVAEYDFINWDDEVYVTVNNYIKDFSPEGIANIFKAYKMQTPKTNLFVDMINLAYLKVFASAKEAMLHANNEYLVDMFFACINNL